MKKIEAYQELVEKRISQIKFPDTPHNLYDPLRYFLKIGGKRTRPALTLLACNLFGEPGIKAIDAAIAIELFHNFTLIHDDIMDEAPLRRGHETVHQKWNRDVAILSGDALFSEAVATLAKSDACYLKQLFAIFSRTSLEVCEGQQMDMDFETSSVVSIEDYIEMIRLKTSVLIGASLEMGAVMSGCTDENDLQNIYDFGVNIGLAFQIQDDLLDLYADSPKFGKQVGGDILANKKTFLLLSAYHLADEETKNLLTEQLESTHAEEKVEAVKLLFKKLGVRKITEQKKEEFYQKALTNMSHVNVPEENKRDLLLLAKHLMSRDH